MAALEGIDLSDYAKTTDLDEYAKKVSPALSGTPTAPTAAKTVNNTQIATTAFVHLLAGAANNGGIVDSLLAQNGYVKFANGLILQWGKYTNSGNDRVITYPIAFSELYYANVISPDNCETFVYGISSTNINYRLCNGYNDDRWNGTQTSRLFAVGR